MDGTIARYRNTASKFGFFYDKATDAVTMTIMFWAMAILVGIVESTMARLRLNRVRLLLLISFALAFFGLIVTLWRA